MKLSATRAVRVGVPILLGVATFALGLGYALPLMSVETLVFWEDHYTLPGSVVKLWQGEKIGLALLIGLFSIAFPVVKLLVMAWVWWWPMGDVRRVSVIHWLGVLGKWSMLDVFVVAMIVVLVQSKGMLDASPKAGLYAFTVAVVLSTVSSIWIERVARHVGEDGQHAG